MLLIGTAGCGPIPIDEEPLGTTGEVFASSGSDSAEVEVRFDVGAPDAGAFWADCYTPHDRDFRGCHAVCEAAGMTCLYTTVAYGYCPEPGWGDGNILGFCAQRQNPFDVLPTAGDPQVTCACREP